jgi:uracil phosphoribosyltransferase
MIHELSNPVAKTLLNHLRETRTDALRFRHIVQELARLLVYEALHSEPMEEQTIETWQGDQIFHFINPPVEHKFIRRSPGRLQDGVHQCSQPT